MPQCIMCQMQFPAELLNRHIVAVHKHDANFSVHCNFPGCGATYNKWKSYRQHLWRKHNTHIEQTEEGDGNQRANGNQEGNENDEIPMDVDVDNLPPPRPNQHQVYDAMTPKEKLQFQSANFVANLRENLLITQTTIEKVVEGLSQLVEEYLSIIQAALVEGDPPVAAVSVEKINEVFADCKLGNIFKLCQSSHRLNSFIYKQSNYVAPEKISVGKEWVWAKTGQIEEVEQFAYHVPFLKNLEVLLNNRDILHCVENPRPHEEGVLKTVTDGDYYRNHEVVKKDSKALSIMLYYDDVEFTNPLGSKTRKLAMFYWVLLNIYPESRSSIRAHNLLAICTSQNLKKFGLDPILEKFNQEVNQLQEGVTFSVFGERKVFRGILNVVAGDTPAAALMGGFKEGVGRALSPCRRCRVRHDEIKNQFDVASFALRNATSHSRHLNMISTPNLTPLAKAYWTKHFGINRRSCLLDIQYLDVTRCIPHDFMHVGLEGVVAAHITCFIKFCVNEDKFSLNALNVGIANFNYKGWTKDKPSPIEATHLVNGIKQNAVQILALGQTLPFIIGSWLDETVKPHLEVFILLMQIVNLVMAFELHREDADIINMMVRIHHLRFKELYGDTCITPKWHYLLHIGEQILLFGPPRQHWCLRCEAVHSYFKNVSVRVKNFRNLPFTLSDRRQKLLCCLLAPMPGADSKSFLYYGDDVMSGSTVTLQNYVHKNLVSQCLPDLQENCEVMISETVHVKGTFYKKGSVLLLSENEESLPSFGKIEEILVRQNKKLIIFSVLDTEYFEQNLNAYKVSQSDAAELSAVLTTDITFPHYLPLLKYGTGDFVILSYHRRTEFMG